MRLMSTGLGFDNPSIFSQNTRHSLGQARCIHAVLCGFSGLAKHLVNAQCGCQGTPLHAALYADHGADVNLGDGDGRALLVRAYSKSRRYAIVARTRSKPRRAVPLNRASFASCGVPWTS